MSCAASARAGAFGATRGALARRVHVPRPMAAEESPLRDGVDLALLRAIADHLPAMLAYWDSAQRCRFANRAYEKWFGVKPEALLGKHMTELLGPLYALNLPYIEGALRGDEQEFEREIPDPAGGPARYSQAHYIPDVVDGVVRGFCVLVVDITRRKRAEDALLAMERQVQAAERLTAMATLAGGIAHEINNPLATVLANIELALERIDREEPTAVRSALEQARDSAKRMGQIVQSMRLLARGDTSQRELVDVDRTLEQSLGVASNVIRYRARVVRDLQDVGCILGNASQLAQVFVNLLMNAAQALPEVGSEKNEIRVSSRREGGEIVVEVADNGSGIPEELQARIFEPFFTTKDVGAGMGLGLSISSAIVKGFGGTIAVRSKVGEGSVFTVRMPAAPGAVVGPRAPASAAEASRSAPAPAAARRPRVLVVDDEPALASTLQSLLAEEFDVTVLGGGRAAIAALSSGELDVDVILCDLMMPDVTGADVHAEVTRARPELARRFVFMTGGAFTPRGRQFLESIQAPVLDKPFRLAEVRAIVRARAERSAELPRDAVDELDEPALERAARDQLDSRVACRPTEEANSVAEQNGHDG